MCILTAGGDDELHVDDVSNSDGAAADEEMILMIRFETTLMEI